MNHTTLMSSRSACQRRHFKEPTSELQERLCSRDSPRGGEAGPLQDRRQDQQALPTSPARSD